MSDVYCSMLPPVRRYHSHGRACVRTHVDSVVRSFDLSVGQVFEIPVVVC